MKSDKNFFSHLDNTKIRNVKFGDGKWIKYGGNE